MNYDCALVMNVSGQVPSRGLEARWTVRADASDGWSVQLLASGTDTDQIAPDDAARAFSGNVFATGVVTTTFVLRVDRARCTTAAANIALSAQGELRDLAATGTSIANPARQTVTTTLQPQLAEIPAPSIAFSGSLDFGAVDLSPDGTTSVTTGSIGLVVTGLDQACGTWSVSISGNELENAQGATISAGNLALVAVNGETVSGGGCRTDAGCVIATIPAGSDRGEVDLTLTLTLRVPVGTDIGRFSSSLRASIVQL